MNRDGEGVKTTGNKERCALLIHSPDTMPYQHGDRGDGLSNCSIRAVTSEHSRETGDDPAILPEIDKCDGTRRSAAERTRCPFWQYGVQISGFDGACHVEVPSERNGFRRRQNGIRSFSRTGFDVEI